MMTEKINLLTHDRFDKPIASTRPAGIMMVPSLQASLYTVVSRRTLFYSQDI